MLTVKYINTDRVESVYTAQTVQYFPFPSDRQPAEDAPYGVKCTFANNEITWHQMRRAHEPRGVNDSDPVIYVMNEAGKTVATYYL